MDDPATIRTGPGPRGHRSLPHTADVILQSWGPDVAACCEEAVAGLVALYVDAPGGAIVETRTRHLRPDAADAMLMELLEEVIFTLDTAQTVPVRAQVREAADGGLDVVLELAARGSVEPTGAVPKAISRSGLRFEVDQRGARCSFLVDV
jgi:SHS2 domain-containing protein